MSLNPPKLWRHFGISMLILVVSYILFTLLPTLVPHPEDLGPYAFSMAFIAGLITVVTGPRGKRKWLYAPLLLVTLLALLDEAGYGSEVMDIKPFYSQSLHTEIRDLHNLITLVIELAGNWLQAQHWNGEQFLVFLAFDALLVLAAILFGWLLRWRMNQAKEADWRRRVAWLVAGGLALAGLVTAIHLILLPGDPKNALLLGFSADRWIMLLAILGLSLVPLGTIVYFQRRNTDWPQKLETLVQRSRPTLVVAGLGVLILSLLYYQYYAPFQFLPDQQTRLQRITPAALWLLAIAVMLQLGELAWKGLFRRSITQYCLDGISFFRREPAYFYTLIGMVLILVAQLNDKGFIPIDTWIQTPNYRITEWGRWTEEVFETVGAFLFTVSAAYFRNEPK